MAAHLISSSFLVSSFILLSSFPLHSETACPPSYCGSLSTIVFPFFLITHENYVNWDSQCGVFPIDCSEDVPTILSEDQKKLYLIKNISYNEHTLLLQDWHLLLQLQQGECGLYDPFETPASEFLRGPTLNLFRCNLNEYNSSEWPIKEYYNYTSCRANEVLFFTEKEVNRPPPIKGCTQHQLPIQPSSSNSYRNDSLSSIVEAGFNHSWEISPSCISDCLPNHRSCELENLQMPPKPYLSSPVLKHNCSTFQYPVSKWLMDPYGSKQQDLWTLLAPGFGLVWQRLDLYRHQHEINLANLAINMLYNQGLHVLINPRLEFQLDSSVGRMITPDFHLVRPRFPFLDWH